METVELSTELAGPRPDTSDAQEHVAVAEALTITNNTEYEQACEFEKGLRALDKRIVEHHATRKRMADQLHKRLVAEEKEDRGPVALALGIIRPKRIAYEQEQERARKEEERRQRELQAKADEERRIQAALEAEAAGKTQEAEKILDRVEPVARIAVPSSLPKSGIAKRTYWGFEALNLKELVQAAAKDDRYLPFLDFHAKHIGAQVQSLKDMCNIPGIKVWSERR